MSFDWPRFLEAQGIHYVTRGANVARGHVNIQCPFCGSADGSHHMGLRLSDAAWACYRDPEHRGRNVAWLLSRLLGCSWDEGKKIVEQGTAAVSVGVPTLMQEVDRLYEAIPKEPSQPETHELPLEFWRFHGDRWEDPFLCYLLRRGFPPRVVAERFGFRYCVSGRYQQRLILPFWHHGDCLGWTARAIVPAKIRYDTFPIGESAASIVYNASECERGGRLLFIVEGPLDVVKLSMLVPSTVGVCGLLGLSITPGKLAILRDLVPRFERTVLLLDAGAEVQALTFQSELATLRMGLQFLPGGYEDPGELDARGAEMVLHEALG